ncbi:hypothetical protein Micbo1qcDRAFT_234391 [Microdochium bolleyi]|uniref:F-box domain-containing protein n=1 Tax=Microdochium bolleyi TaxID=196109 RepID=A0A136J1U4_9PEZI|nr:hypothetical protein Micbo1qcDRAFT_234391 [Microdochium bolleyi]
MERGKELYAQKQYAQAAKYFIRALDSCPCGIAYREKPCLCKSIVVSIESKTLKDELRKPCICSAKSARRCERKAHVDAFDSLAAAREKEGLLDESMACTEQMINLSPREPKGYLRLGKVLRLQGKPQVAYEAYTAGAQLVAAKHPEHALLPILNAQAAKVKGMTRTDPLAKLPYELIRMILREVGFRTLCLSLRVSKTWRAVLTSAMAQDLWRTQHYYFTHHKPRGFAGPKTALRYASFGGGQLTDLTIDNCKQFGINLAQLGLILSRCGKHLRHLKLRGALTSEVSQGSVSSFKLPLLESLYIGLGIKVPHKWLLQLLRDTSSTIRELAVFDLVPDPGDRPRLFHMTEGPNFQIRKDISWPAMPQLQSLSLSATSHVQIYLNHMASVTPNLQRLWLDEVEPIIEDPDGVNWPKLKCLFVGSNIISRERFGSRHCIRLNPDMEELYVEEHGLNLVPYLDAGRGWPTGEEELAKLRKVGLRHHSSGPPVRERELELLLRPSLESGTLQEVSLHPFPLERFLSSSSVGAARNPSAAAATAMDWFRGDSVTSLAFTGLLAEGYRSAGTADDAVFDLVSRFPSLRTLDISQEQIQNATLGRIIARGVKTMYYAGDLREDLREWAAKTHSAKLVYGPCRASMAEIPDRPSVARRLAQSAKRVRERPV